MSGTGVFHYFGELPAELRLMIWEYSQTPRLLHLKYMQTRNVLTIHPKKDIPFIPAVFHVCQESRDFALRRYQILILNPTPPVQSRVYVDFDLDVVYFNNRFNRFGGYERPWGGINAPNLFRDWDKEKGTNVDLIKFIAFDCQFYQGLTSCTSVPRGLIKHFTNLREFMFVPITKRYSGRDFGKFVDQFGFEFIPVDELKEEEPLYREIQKYSRYFHWDLLEYRTYNPPGDWAEQDMADPNYNGTQPVTDYRGDFWPASGYIEDPFLKNNDNELFRNTKMRIVRDWNIFIPELSGVRREQLYTRQFELEQMKPNGLNNITPTQMRAIRSELRQLKSLNLEREEDLVEHNAKSLQIAEETRPSEYNLQLALLREQESASGAQRRVRTTGQRETASTASVSLPQHPFAPVPQRQSRPNFQAEDDS